ncbi:hypothetical protein [Hymenobacter psoromatis]|uniref:hypothetical protein n=1 Tax=Hymenobacter psoromatis TaxID=1484116 RepID=UPI001CBF224B|nr:hypothetical protein [Hymenobacter psoromatis]
MPTPYFGPNAQTPEQRARVLEQMQQAIPSLRVKANVHAFVRGLYAQYVAGEVSWQQVSQALEHGFGRQRNPA